MKTKYWKVCGSRGLRVYWYVSGFDSATGDGTNIGPFDDLWVARLVCWWHNFRGTRP